MQDTRIKENEEIHDLISSEYEGRHGEIFNKVEQARLSKEIRSLNSYLNTRADKLIALDIGCGSGNVTNHLLEAGYQVIASDVSNKFLDLVAGKFNEDDLSVFKLNGIDLKGVESASVDLVVMYSVLHHIPDYLKILEECVRVVKDGGVIYIDHEHNDDFWADMELYSKYKAAKRRDVTISDLLLKYINPLNYYTFLKRKIMLTVNPRYQPEGDIHVFKDDHIEWSKINEVFSKHNLSVIKDLDYLHFQSDCKHSTFLKYEGLVTDMKLLVAQKKST